MMKLSETIQHPRNLANRDIAKSAHTHVISVIAGGQTLAEEGVGYFKVVTESFVSLRTSPILQETPPLSRKMNLKNLFSDPDEPNDGETSKIGGVFGSMRKVFAPGANKKQERAVKILLEWPAHGGLKHLRYDQRLECMRCLTQWSRFDTLARG